MSSGTKTTYVGAEATTIADAFRVFVKVHQELLDVLIGTGGFLTRIPFVGPPIAAVLRAIESFVDVSSYLLPFQCWSSLDSRLSDMCTDPRFRHH
jgi:hypothetical protein